MDEGCYIIDCIYFLTKSTPISVVAASASPSVNDPRVDQTTTASLKLPGGVTASFTCSLGLPPKLGFIPHSLPKNEFRVVGESGEVFCFSWVIPTFYHYIQVKTNDGKTRTEKVYRPKDGVSEKMKDWEGEEWWSRCVFVFT